MIEIREEELEELYARRDEAEARAVERQTALEIIGRALAELMPDFRARGSVIEHAQAQAQAIRALHEEVGRLSVYGPYIDGAALLAAATRVLDAKLVVRVHDGNCGDHERDSEKYLGCDACAAMPRSERGQAEDAFRALVAAAPAALVSQTRVQVRREALREAAKVCRRGCASGEAGHSWRLDCAEEIEALVDEP